MDFYILIAIIILAFVFDFINGFHDAANSIATVVSTKVLTPLQAVIWAAFFNFAAYAIQIFPYIGGGFYRCRCCLCRMGRNPFQYNYQDSLLYLFSPNSWDVHFLFPFSPFIVDFQKL